MDRDFWHQRWADSQIGFHQSVTNPALVEHWDKLGLRADDGVFVPLCGKSLDLWWLRDRGHSILGVELSPVAVRDFFREAGVEPTSRREGPFVVSETERVRILQGDFFDLSA